MAVPIFEETREEAKVTEPNQMMMSKKQRLENWNKKNNSDELIGSDTEIAVPPESKVGAKVQQEVQKNVISMIILILLSIPLLDGSTWFNSVTIYDKAQESLIFYAKSYPSLYQTNANLFVARAANNFLNPLLYFSVEVGSVNDSFPDNYVEYAGTVN